MRIVSIFLPATISTPVFRVILLLGQLLPPAATGVLGAPFSGTAGHVAIHVALPGNGMGQFRRLYRRRRKGGKIDHGKEQRHDETVKPFYTSLILWRR